MELHSCPGKLCTGSKKSECFGKMGDINQDF